MVGKAVEMMEKEAPSGYALEGNHPNPFNPTMRIRFVIPESSPVKLMVYDALGRRVHVLVDGVRETGIHEVKFDATALAERISTD